MVLPVHRLSTRRTHGVWLGWLLLALCYCSAAFAAPTFPALSGRVVDEAGLLSTDVRASLTQQLETHETKTTNQVVVVTLSSLQGYAIDDYGYQLGRHWGIGQKDKNNGVLLIVAPEERKVRIEVGYGLEGQLTDALSKTIIETAITPQFRQNNYAGGIQAGVDTILKVLEGGELPQAKPPQVKRTNFDNLGFLLIASLFSGQLLTLFMRRKLAAGVTWVGATLLGWWLLSSLWLAGIFSALVAFFLLVNAASPRGGGGWGSGSGGGGGGFSGGGGSFGGGGASGSW